MQNSPGISRIDSKQTHGWYARVYGMGTVLGARYFPDRLFGGATGYFKALNWRIKARAVVDRLKTNERSPMRPRYLSRFETNKTGCVGVSYCKTVAGGRNVEYYKAVWAEDGKTAQKKFYVNSKRTKAEALAAAISARSIALQEIELTTEYTDLSVGRDLRLNRIATIKAEIERIEV